MALQPAHQELRSRLEQLRDALSDLRLTVAEDKPLKGDAALIDHRTDTIEDVMGSIEEAIAAAAQAHRAVQPPADTETARDALVKCHAAFNAAFHRFHADLISYDRVAELAGLGRHRGGEWLVWAMSVKDALHRCEQPVHDVNHALFTCWRELSERSHGNSVNVRATSVGQKILMPIARSEHSDR